MSWPDQDDDNMMQNPSDSIVWEVITGALSTWGMLEHLTVLKAVEPVGAVEIHDAVGETLASVRRGDSPLGQVWQVRIGERRERVFPSVVTTLRYLRGHICPEREAGRVLFGQGEQR